MGARRPSTGRWDSGRRRARTPGRRESLVNPDFQLSEDKVKNQSAYITPENLIDLANEFKSLGVDFKIKIDSCYSGRFERVFREANNVAVLETSSAADEVGYTFAIAPGQKYLVADPITHKATKEAKADDTDNPDGASSFVNANVHGLMEWAATAPPDSTLLTGILNSLTLSDGFDFAENINYTHPLKLNRTPFDDTPLTISPIKAEFVDADRATYYTVPTVNDFPGAIIFYDWTLSLEAVPMTLSFPGARVDEVGPASTEELIVAPKTDQVERRHSIRLRAELIIALTARQGSAGRSGVEHLKVALDVISVATVPAAEIVVSLIIEAYRDRALSRRRRTGHGRRRR